MSVKNKVVDLTKEEIMDDLTNKDENVNEAASVDLDKLAELKAKLEAKKQQDGGTKKKVEKPKTLKWGVVGSGQAGSRVAQSFYSLGYDSVVLNTTNSDLENIQIPASNKLCLEYSLGGAAKNIEIGKAAAEANRERIVELVSTHLANSQMFIFCTSLSGGSGSGSSEVIIDILNSLQKPVLVIGILPMQSDDATSKSNALIVLNTLLKQVQNKRICNLIVVDNAKIEAIFHDVGQMDFFNVANKAIVAPLDAFNLYSSCASPVKSLDQLEWAKLLADGEGLSVYGEFEVENYAEDETSLAEAVVGSLSNNLLSGGFNIKQSKLVGAMFCANKKVWAKIPSSSVNYAMAILDEECGHPTSIFKGIYETDDDNDFVKVYSFFSGLGLPDMRIEQLQKEVKANAEVIKNKDIKRNLTLNIDTGEDQSVSDAQKIKDKIANRSSTFGKFLQQNVVDRRK